MSSVFQQRSILTCIVYHILQVLILEVKKAGKWVYETPRAAGKYHYEVTLPMQSKASPDSDPDYEVMEPPPHTTL